MAGPSSTILPKRITPILSQMYLATARSSKLIVALAGGPPNPITVSKPVSAIFDFVLNLLVTKGGMKIVGSTETGQPFYHGAAERIMVVRAGSAKMDGKDLGVVSRPTWPVRFGDSGPCIQAAMKQGTLYIPYEQELEVATELA